jgi:predicted transcriptional regulator
MVNTGASENKTKVALTQLATLVTNLIKKNTVTTQERDAAKAQIAQLLADEETEDTAELQSINELIDVASAALPGEVAA